MGLSPSFFLLSAKENKKSWVMFFLFSIFYSSITMRVYGVYR